MQWIQWPINTRRSIAYAQVLIKGYIEVLSDEKEHNELEKVSDNSISSMYYLKAEWLTTKDNEAFSIFNSIYYNNGRISE